MAGKEQSGFAASRPQHLHRRLLHFGAGEGVPQAVAVVEGLARQMGFGRVVKSPPKSTIGTSPTTSQVPHVLACAYVLSPRCREHQGFSAGSYRDVSRVANINDALWSRLFLDNRQCLVEELDELQRNLGRFRQAVDQADEEELRRLLQAAAQVKREVG